MKELAVNCLDLLMVGYVGYRMFITAIFLPLAGGFFYGHMGLYFVLLIFVAGGSLVFGFFDRRGWACVLAAVVGLAAISYWCSICLAFKRTIWEGFYGPVAPDLLFSACGAANWFISRSTLQEGGADEAAAS